MILDLRLFINAITIMLSVNFWDIDVIMYMPESNILPARKVFHIYTSLQMIVDRRITCQIVLSVCRVNLTHLVEHKCANILLFVVFMGIFPERKMNDKLSNPIITIAIVIIRTEFLIVGI